MTALGARPRVVKARRSMKAVREDGSCAFVAWRLFERIEGVAPTERDADAAIEHFLSSPTSYTLANGGRR